MARTLKPVPLSENLPLPQPKPRGKRRTCLVVLGAHRSGTSALAGTLGLLGATVPADLLGRARSNAKGHFESTGVLALNKDLLAAQNTCWFDFRQFGSPTQPSPSNADQFRTELTKALHRSFGQASLFVLKDPRICRFFPL